MLTINAGTGPARTGPRRPEMLTRLRRTAVPWATPLYIGGVQLGAHATARLPARRRTELLRAHSTNVANLRAGRWRTLVTSAAFVEHPLPLPYGAALLAALGTAEARWGTGRAAGVFMAGHIGASLLVYAGLRAQEHVRPAHGPTGDTSPDATTQAIDVGASYGFNATVGALAATVPHRGIRAAATGGLLALATAPVLRRSRTFTDAGHLAALALGVAMGAGMRGGIPSPGAPHRGQITDRLVQ
ncbi:rhomboid-like protein [Streptomyces sp. bgisy084]|uniref:rhomboid-like protein n=1 Tax=Streptomyces sp. bgisy084 TaxID=3413777 RepID=UPI003D707DD6